LGLLKTLSVSRDNPGPPKRLWFRARRLAGPILLVHT